MNKVFNFKRFGKYFVYDIRNAWNNFGLSMLVCALLPLLCFAVAQLFSLIINGVFSEHLEVSRWMAICIAPVVVILTAPNKIYGKITRNREGSDFILLPASVTEKYVSMLLTLCVVLPFAFLFVLFACDSLLCLLFPLKYGSTIISMFSGHNLFNLTFPEFSGEIGINVGLYLIQVWVIYILAFNLGAIFFKKAKVAKTILVFIGIGIVLSMISVIFFGSFDVQDFIETMSPMRSLDLLNNFIAGCASVEIIVLLVLTFLRLKTIKH